MIRRLLQARRVLDPPQRQLRQQLNNAPPPLLRQRLPNGQGSGEAHGAIQASARLREALCSPESATRRILSTYKRHLLWEIERAFRCLKTVDLHVRPIHHWLEDRVRAHVFLCMLAYYVEWNLRAKLAAMLYDDDDKEAAEALRDSPVAKAQRSPSALAKSATGRAADGVPVHSFQSLLADLATLARNTIVTAIAPDRPFTVLTRPTPIQQKAFDLLAIPIACTQ
jgi:hypothetical protein